MERSRHRAPLMLLVAATATAEATAGLTAPVKGRVYEAVPASIDPAQRYVIYVHGRILEEQGRRAVSLEFGAYEYDKILAAFAERGFAVVSRLRKGDLGEAAADQTANDVRRLLQAGVPAGRIVVVGFSKGGGIAVGVAARVAEPETRYAILAGCSSDPPWIRDHAPRLRGRMLSLYDQSDRFRPSCKPLFSEAKGLTEAEEVVLQTGLDHGVFFTPRENWLAKVVAWAQRGATQR